MNNESKNTETQDLLKVQNEQLKAQLMSNSLINELTKVLNSCQDQDSIIKTVMLGIQDILNFDRVILFEVDKQNFCLNLQTTVGIHEEINFNDFRIPLSFEGGEITDTVFLNRHLIVDEPDTDSDVFYKSLASESYLVIPFLKRSARKCWEIRNCHKLTCPAYGSGNPNCWSIQGAQQLLYAPSEDERRRQCVACECFGAEGVFWMDRKFSGRAVTSDDITVLTTILTQASVIIDNFRIFNALEIAHLELKKTNERLKVTNHDLSVAQSRINSDLEHARSIQQGLLPQGSLDTEQFSTGALYIPADKVGGDYYDIFPIKDSVYGVIVADVSGHGVASALIMAMVKVLLKSYVKTEMSPQKTLERINLTFMSEIQTDNFVTIFYAVIDTENKTMQFTSAGHCPVLFLNKETGECLQRKADGLFLGAFDEMMLEEQGLRYEPGKFRMVLYTDGLIEAQNKDNEMYDVERLQQISVKTLDVSPKEATEVVMNDQRDFCGPGHVPEDDITMLIIDL